MPMSDDTHSALPEGTALLAPTSPPPLSLLGTIRQWLSTTLKLGSQHSLEESVAELIEEHDPEGTISSEERILLHNIVSFGELKVRDVMVPRADIVSVPETITLPELTRYFIIEAHTRMPVYSNTLDNVIGFVHIKDLLPFLVEEKAFVLKDILRNILFVPPSLRIIDLLVKMQAEHVHMALVLDEYGGVNGLLTIEDLVEEIVGEIEDEHDENEEPEITIIDAYTMKVSARLPIDKLEELLGIALVPEQQEDEFDTVGGFILSLVGHVPVVGEHIKCREHITFEVIEADPRRVKRILIHSTTNAKVDS